MPAGAWQLTARYSHLDLNDPARVVYRSQRPVLSPQHNLETSGGVNNVVTITMMTQAEKVAESIIRSPRTVSS